MNGLVKAVDVKNVAAADVLSVCQSLRNQSGRPIRRKWAGARGPVTSVQGHWTPAFNFVEPKEQMRKEVEKRTQLIGVTPPISERAKLPPPPLPHTLTPSPPSFSSATRSSSRSPSAPLPLSFAGKVTPRQQQQQQKQQRPPSPTTS